MSLSTLLWVPLNCFKPMDNEQRSQFVRYHRLEQRYHRPFKITNENITSFARNNPALQLIHQRVVEWGNAKISTSVALFLSFLSRPYDDHAGKTVLWAYTVTFLYHQKEKMVTMNDLAKAFKFGFPTNDGVMKVWEQQKDEKGLNTLDEPQYWKAENFVVDAIEWAIA